MNMSIVALTSLISFGAGIEWNGIASSMLNSECSPDHCVIWKPCKIFSRLIKSVFVLFTLCGLSATKYLLRCSLQSGICQYLFQILWFYDFIFGLCRVARTPNKCLTVVKNQLITFNCRLGQRCALTVKHTLPATPAVILDTNGLQSNEA